MPDLAQKIETLLAPTIEAMGFDVVRVQITGQARVRVQVMAERRDGQAMTVDDCAGISRAISAVLDVEDPIRGAFTLEVSSPGIDRPLVRPRDFERFAGFEAKVELGHPLEGRRRFRGRLEGIDDGMVCMMVEGTPVRLPFQDIARAKLVLTDELLAATQGRQQG